MNEYAPPTVWNHYYSQKAESGADLNPDGIWAQAWLPFLTSYTVTAILDLGCGTGGDSLVLAREGYTLTGIDYSREAVTRATAKAAARGLDINFVQGDMAQPLPFADRTFDMVMSNVALHMFDDATTRRIVAEVQRIVRPTGLFCFNVNSTEDMPYRALRYQRVREIEPNFWLEAHGQTMHFFDEDYCRALFASWSIVSLDPISLQDESTGDIFKCIWRGVLQNR